MTTIDRTTATDAEFAERIAGFETASMPPGVLRELVRLAIQQAGVDDFDAAVAADAALAVVAQQPHPVVQRVEALAESWRYKGEFGWGPWQAGEGPDIEGQVLDECAAKLRRALAGDPQ